MPYVEWHIGQAARHKDIRDDFRRLEIATVTGRVQPIIIDHDDGEESILSLEAFGLGPPDDVEDAFKGLIYAITLAVIAAVLGVLNYFYDIPGMGKLPRRNGRHKTQEIST